MYIYIYIYKYNYKYTCFDPPNKSIIPRSVNNFRIEKNKNIIHFL